MNGCCGSPERERPVEEIIILVASFSEREHLSVKGIVLYARDFDSLRMALGSKAIYISDTKMEIWLRNRPIEVSRSFDGC